MLLNPNQIHAVLEDSGLVPKKATGLAELLERHSLTPDDALGELKNVILGAESQAVKLKALDMVFEMNGMLEDKAINIPIVNIIINDSEFAINPILLPR